LALGPLPNSDLDLACPRCKRAVTERFYGPCEQCRAELRASIGNEASDIEAVEYEPKMNVVPNAIASKE
jgi:hypothetical protein